MLDMQDIERQAERELDVIDNDEGMSPQEKRAARRDIISDVRGMQRECDNFWASVEQPCGGE